MTKQEIISELKDAEIRSLQYEDIVYFADGNLNGSVRGKIKSINSMSKKETSELFNEYFEQEFGTRNPKDLI